MKKLKLNNNGAVLLTVICLMSVLTLVLMTAIIVVASSNKKAITNYTDNQVYVTAKSTLDTFMDYVADNSSVDFDGIRTDINAMAINSSIEYTVKSPLSTIDKIKVEKISNTMTHVTATSYCNGNQASVSREMKFTAGSSANKTDIVFVFDCSGSMSGTDRYNAAQAVKTFAQTLLVDNPNTAGNVKIGLAKFDTSSQEILGLTDNNVTIQAKLNEADVLANVGTGGTNIQDGIRKAESMFSGSAATNKFIIILGDGMPTYSYEVTGWPTATNPLYTFGIRLGKGNDFKPWYKSSSGVWHYYYFIEDNMGINHKISDNKFGTVCEAKNLKHKGYKIMTIGFGLNETDLDAVKTLKEVADSGYFYKANKTGTDDTLDEVLDKVGKDVEESSTGQKYINK